jgi:hypothetical protein
MDLKEYIKSLIRKELEETSTSSGSGVGDKIATLNWVAPKGQKKNAATKQAEEEGWKLTKGETEAPGDSKIKDYEPIWKSAKKKKVKIYEMDTNKTFKYSNKIFKIGDKVTYGMGRDKSEWTISDIFKLGPKDMFKLTPVDSESGLKPTDFEATRIASDNLNESLLNVIKQELLNEVTYHKFKNEVKFRTKNEQLHKAIREVKRKLMEIDRIVEYTSRMKQELSEGEEGVKYWKATQKNVATISEMVNQLNNKIKNLQQ